MIRLLTQELPAIRQTGVTGWRLWDIPWPDPLVSVFFLLDSFNA